MSNIGTFSFTEESKLKIQKLSDLIGEDENFVNSTNRVISMLSFNDVLKDSPKEIIQELKRLADNPELFQSYFRVKVAEDKLKKSYTNCHNLYIEKFVNECGNNYSEDVLEQIKALKF